MEKQATFPPVGEAESGQKLLRFLERRLSLPPNLLHRWLRTGQIRLNGKRCKPFVIVQTADEIRLPPFAAELAIAPVKPDLILDLPPLLGSHNDIWAFNKPRGLLSQPGKRGELSLSGLLAAHCATQPFKPVPAHRLDRDTSGVILVGATFQALRGLHIAFRDRLTHKEYLAWVIGKWPHPDTILLRHYLCDYNGIKVYSDPDQGRMEALCIVRPLAIKEEKSLLQVVLLTGRKRQIRAQLTACGHPVIGDNLYSAPCSESLKLHSCRIILPDGFEFFCLPDWSGEFAVADLPRPIQDINQTKTDAR